MEPGFEFLSSRAKAPTKQDWSKLVKVMSFMMGTTNEVLTLSADDSQNLHWHTDAAFGVYPGMRSYSDGTFSMGFGVMSSSSTKQKVKSRSLTEVELIAVDNKTSKVVWSKRFTEAQGFKVKLTIVFQDNASTIKLAENGKLRSGKKTRHFDMRLFHVTDLINRKEVAIKHYPNGKMLADYFSKLLVGKLFRMMRSDAVDVAFKE